jgi:hypothetical protein
VGQSVGSFAGGDGETADALAVIEWAMGEYPDMPLYLAGFSFGAMVAIRAATQQMPAALITVAPAIRFFDAAFTRPSCPWLVIQGEADEIVSAAEVAIWARSLEPPPALITLSAVGHFFHGALGTIPEAAGDFLDSVPDHAPARKAVT